MVRPDSSKGDKMDEIDEMVGLNGGGDAKALDAASNVCVCESISPWQRHAAQTRCSGRTATGERKLIEMYDVCLCVLMVIKR